MLGFLINKQSGILSKLTPHSVLAAVGTVGSWQPGIKQCLQQEKERKQVCVRPKMPGVKLRDFQRGIVLSFSVLWVQAWTWTVSFCYCMSPVAGG